MKRRQRPDMGCSPIEEQEVNTLTGVFLLRQIMPVWFEPWTFLI
jgi:hypothetical protein